MAELKLKPVDGGADVGSKPILSPSLLKPWKFDYSPSPNGQDRNLLIMFHGLGDTKAPFAQLGRQLNLPSTAILSLQAPDQIPLLEEPAWSWYNTFDPMFEPLPNPNPSTHIPKLRSLLSTLTSPEVGWSLTQIHLFGFAQGGTMALELALDIGKSPIDVGGEKRKRLGSVVSVCGGLISFPSSDMGLETPICYFTRSNPRSQIGQKSIGAVKRGFKKVEVIQGDAGQGGGESMPRGQTEWRGIMKFWGEVLGREEKWKGEGEVFEVVK